MPNRIAPGYAAKRRFLARWNLSVIKPWFEIRFSAVFPSRQCARIAFDSSRTCEARSRLPIVSEMHHFLFHNWYRKMRRVLFWQYKSYLFRGTPCAEATNEDRRNGGR
jgi:hypothetical protein